MALFGGQVQAINMAPDTRQSVAAARELAMTGAQGITGMVGQVGDYFKQQGEKKKLVKSASSQIDAALKLMPELAPTLSEVANRIKDENVPLDERVADATSIENLIKMSIMTMKNAQMMNIRAAKAGGGGSGGGGASSGGGGVPAQSTGGGWTSGGFSVQ